MTIQVLDGPTVPASVGAINVTLDTIPVSFVGAVTDPVNSVNGAINRALDDISASLLGTFTAPPVSGTTHLVLNGTTMLAVRNLNINFGDEVLFEAGATFIITGNGDKLITKSGVKYGRFGTGANPILDGAGSSVSPDFTGFILSQSVNNVIIDGIDVTALGHNSFLIFTRFCNNVIIRNCKAYEASGGGIVSVGGTNYTVQDCEIHHVRGGPHESISVTGGTDGFLIERCYSHNNGHGAMLLKAQSTNGEVRFCKFERTTNDPMCYPETCNNVRVHHNLCQFNDEGNPGNGFGIGFFKPLASAATEDFGPFLERKNINVEFDHNTLYDCFQYSMQVWVKFTAFIAAPVNEIPTPVIGGLHIHHNTFHTSNKFGTNFWHQLQFNNDAPELDGNPGLYFQDIVIENNIFWEAGNAKSINQRNIPSTVRDNLFQTGSTGDFGTGSIFTSDVMIADAANGDFSLLPGSPAIGAANDGADMGSGLSDSDVL